MARVGKKRRVSWVRGFLGVLLVALLLAVVFRAFFLTSFMIDGESMLATLHHEERVLVNNLVFHLRTPERGEIVVFDDPDGTEPVVKRIVASPGEIVEMREGLVYLNGTPLPEPYLTYRGSDSFEPMKVPTAHVFVLGDNRPVSSDSRHFGPVSISALWGKVTMVYWPPSQVRLWEW